MNNFTGFFSRSQIFQIQLSSDCQLPVRRASIAFPFLPVELSFAEQEAEASRFAACQKDRVIHPILIVTFRVKKSPSSASGEGLLWIRDKFHSRRMFALMVDVIPFPVVFRSKIFCPASAGENVVFLCILHAGRFVPWNLFSTEAA
jgi:hypothetical protein